MSKFEYTHLPELIMTKTNLKKKTHDYIELADEKILKAVYKL